MIIFRYLSKSLLIHVLVITLILLMIFMTNQFMLYLKEVVNGHITVPVVMKLLGLQIPMLLGFLIPLALYLSILLVLGRLYFDHEMTVLSACGLSPFRLIRMIFGIAIPVMLLVAALMFWVEPAVQGFLGQLMEQAIAQATVDKILPKSFQVIGDNQRVFYANEVLRDKMQMKQVFLAEHQPPDKNGYRRWDITVAQLAEEGGIPDAENHFLVFKQGYRYVGIPGQKDYKIMHYDQYGVTPVLKSTPKDVWPKNASTRELIELRHTSLAAVAELHWRLAMPISVLLLTLIAFPLSHVNPRQGKFARLFPAILLYIGYGDLLFLGRAWIEKGALSSHLGLWWVHTIFLIIGLTLLFRPLSCIFQARRI